jgi:hypothetical protein
LDARKDEFIRLFMTIAGRLFLLCRDVLKELETLLRSHAARLFFPAMAFVLFMTLFAFIGQQGAAGPPEQGFF